MFFHSKKFALWVGAAVLGAILAAVGNKIYSEVTKDRGAPVRVNDVDVRLGDEYRSAAYASAFTPSSEDLRAMTEYPHVQHSWLRKTGAVGFSKTQLIKITLGGYWEGGEARVTGADLVDKHCEPALRGTRFESPGGGGSPIATVRFDLDKPVVSTDAFDKVEYVLKKGEPQTFSIETATESQFCEFRVAFHIAAGKDKSTVTVDDAGRPFKVTARLPFDQYRVLYVGGTAREEGCTGSLPFYRQDPLLYAANDDHCSQAGSMEGKTTP
ncbi:hypothetical protein ACH4XT_29440 [Streptomyces avidinii]|uniref:hypothetical protein n=1 Tax=Streptomyces avidinii TaxID=1895 RepID=UPI0037A4D590